MEVIEVMQKIGLTQKQSSVYLALLELGAASVEGIAQKAGIKRPTTYLILDELSAQGLVAQVPNAKRTQYQAESPDTLAGQIYRKQELLKRFMPQMQAIYNARKDKPQVQLFEGHEGIKLLYKRIYSASEVAFFGTTKEVQKYDPQQLWEFVERTQKEKIKVRDLLTRCQEDLAYAQKAKRGPNYEIRFVKEGSKFLTDNAIFDDTVVFFSFHPKVFAVTITSYQISQAIKTLFEFAWAQAEKV